MSNFENLISEMKLKKLENHTKIVHDEWKVFIFKILFN